MVVVDAVVDKVKDAVRDAAMVAVRGVEGMARKTLSRKEAVKAKVRNGASFVVVPANASRTVRELSRSRVDNSVAVAVAVAPIAESPQTRV